ncbi:hypothetical protein FRC09_011798 [Ceratobasidium sp. 395]|nr:hypothetical protein FRC09_011798 [Ceratobasidium sp. 395]
MTTFSEPSAFPSPTSSAPSPYFTEPSTPAEPPVKKSHSRRRPPGHIPRPRNAFILFRTHYVAAQLIPGKVENDHRHISKIIGEIWNTLPPAERLHWEQKADEKHSRMYPGYRYKPTKLEGYVKRRVKCRGTPDTTSPYSSAPGIGNAPRELVGSLNRTENGNLRFVDGEKARFIDQEERRKDPTRCARVAELVKRGVVGEQLEQEALRLGLDRESAMAGAPQLEPSMSDPPGRQGHFHTNINVLRALGELEEGVPIFTNPFTPQNPQISQPVNTRFPGVAHNADRTSNTTSPTTSHSLNGPAATKEAQASLTNSSESGSESDNLGWPHRRASSLPVPPAPPIYREFDAHPHLLIVEPQQTEPNLQTSPRSRRPSSSSPMPRHRWLYDLPLPHTETAGKSKDSQESLGAFGHLTHPSPNASPPGYLFSSDTYSHLQLHYPSSEASPHTTLLSPLYDINLVREQHQHESLDLSVIYQASDIPNGNDSALHSTYAIPAEKTYSSISAAPAHGLGLPARKQVHHQVPRLALGFTRSPDPTDNYDWHAAYGAEPGYHHPPQYYRNDARYDEETRQLFASGAGGPTY